MKRLFITIACLLTFCAGLFAKGDTYIYDHWGEVEKSPDVYRVSSVLYADDLDLEVGLKNPSGLFAVDNYIYLVDTDNNRIIELVYNDNKTVELNRVIDHFYSNGEVTETFNGPMDIFVNDNDETIFIADTGNGRVVKLDYDLNYIMSFVEPDDPTYEKGKTFYPQKVVAASVGRVYILAKNVNKGFLKYEFDGTFTGFYGASEANYDFSTYIWKKFFSTKAQRAQMESFVPTEYSNAYMDSEGFVYSVLKTFSQWDLKSDKAKPIRRLNALGNDILVKNAEYPPIGDLQWGNAAGIVEPAHFTDITVFDDEIYVTCDESRGRIFGYNNQGYLLFAFGGRGNIDGFFRAPSAIEHIGKDLFVLDSMNASLTVFTPTEYGSMIFKATELYADGDYDESAATWKKVLERNGNYDLAYIGLGKACLRQEDYKNAMDYFRLKRDKTNYSKAYQYYRKEWMEANLGWVVAVVLVLILVPLIIKGIKNLVRELKSL